MSVLKWVTKGEFIDTVTIDGVVEPQIVMSPCGDAVHGYYCASCLKNLANIANLIFHLETDGTHRIALWCPRRRVFEQAEESQIDAFASVQAASW